MTEFEYDDYDLDEKVNPVEPGKAIDLPDGLPQDDFEGLGAPGNAPRSGSEALSVARDMSNRRVFVGIGYCLKAVRGYYGVSAKHPSASVSWNHAAHKRPVREGRDVPRGVPVYWTGGSSGFGHIAISLGGGLCYSTDWKEPGRIDVAAIDDITRRWGLKFQGYAWEINDVIVWKPAKPVGEVRLSNLHRGARNADVRKVKERLHKKGYRGFIRDNDKFGIGFRNAYKRYQRKLGYTGSDANGVPGVLSLKKLGFLVKSS